ncbi:Tnrc18p [Xylographa vitiligo]|nr:Tnrc18p [Xylographa vitiligo]
MASQPPNPMWTLPPNGSYPYLDDLTGIPYLPRPIYPLERLGPIIPTDPALNPPRPVLQPPAPLPCCEFPRRNPTDPNRPPTTPPPQRILSCPHPFPPTRLPLRVTFSCTHTAPPSALPALYTRRPPSGSPPPNPPHTLPHPCRECALTLTQTAQIDVHRARDPAIAALEAQIADARREIWVGGGRVVGGADPLLRAYERAHERLRVLLRERAGALWEGRKAWEGVWGEGLGEEGRER